MNKNPLVTVIAVVVVALIIVGAVVAFSGNKPKTDTTNTMNMPTTSKSTKKNTTTPTTANAVTIQNFAYDPTSVTVKVGDTVTWTNKDSVSHTVTSDDGVTGGPNSELIAQGKTYSFTFTKVGTYTYHCTPHPYMKGTVTVTE